MSKILEFLAKDGQSEAGIFFWGHNSEYGFLSNFYEHEIKMFGFTFPTSEHFYMWRKATFFLDFDSAEAIIEAPTAREAKILGRSVKNFNSSWNAYSAGAMTLALIAKFEDAELREKLLETYYYRLVEASPKDSIWRIGLGQDDIKARDENNWGQNLLGKCLTGVRDYYIGKEYDNEYSQSDSSSR